MLRSINSANGLRFTPNSATTIATFAKDRRGFVSIYLSAKIGINFIDA
jgi:hypothetical protein